MTNLKAPKSIWIQPAGLSFFYTNSNGTYYSTPDVESIEYVRADLLATVRRDAFKEAVKIAKSHWVIVPAECENRPLDVQRWQGYNLAAKEITAALELRMKGKG